MIRYLLLLFCFIFGIAHGAQMAVNSISRKFLSQTYQALGTGNIAEFIRKVNLDFGSLTEHLNEIVRQRGEELLAAHTRVRTAARMLGVRHHVEAQYPPDVLGVYVYLPALPETGKAAN